MRKKEFGITETLLSLNNCTLLLIYFSDTSSVDQRHSCIQEDSDTQQTEQERVTDMVTAASPSRETADALAGLEVTTESLSDPSIPEVQGTSSEPSRSADITEEETSETAGPDS